MLGKLRSRTTVDATGPEHGGHPEVVDDINLLGKCRASSFDAQNADYNSRTGVQTGAATTVFDFRNLCGRVQYHGLGSLDRVHDCIFTPSWASWDGLGSSPVSPFS
jgi:hypothetical protein